LNGDRTFYPTLNYFYLNTILTDALQNGFDLVADTSIDETSRRGGASNGKRFGNGLKGIHTKVQNTEATKKYA
jgi:hypothetical protein